MVETIIDSWNRGNFVMGFWLFFRHKTGHDIAYHDFQVLWEQYQFQNPNAVKEAYDIVRKELRINILTKGTQLIRCYAY